MRTDSPYHRRDGREQRSTRTRARIFEAALTEFQRVGFELASVTHIARVARVSRPSFYFHFPTKEHVLLELQWQLEQEIIESVSDIESSSEALHAFVDELFVAEDKLGGGELFREIVQVWARPPPSVNLQQLPSPCLEEVVRRFVAHVQDGASLSMTPERAAVLFLTAVFGYLLGIDGPRQERRADLHALVGLHLGEA